MLLIWSWSTTAIIHFVNVLEPDPFYFSAGSHGMENVLRIAGFIVGLELGLAIVVTFACWLVLMLAGLLVEDRKRPTVADCALTCANQYSFRDELDLPSSTRL